MLGLDFVLGEAEAILKARGAPAASHSAINFLFSAEAGCGSRKERFTFLDRHSLDKAVVTTLNLQQAFQKGSPPRLCNFIGNHPP